MKGSIRDALPLTVASALSVATAAAGLLYFAAFPLDPPFLTTPRHPMVIWPLLLIGLASAVACSVMAIGAGTRSRLPTRWRTRTAAGLSIGALTFLVHVYLAMYYGFTQVT